MSRSRTSPRKFSEKIALLNKREADTTAEFEKIIQEVEATTRAPSSPRYHSPTPTTNSVNWLQDNTTTSSHCTDNTITYHDGYQTSSEVQQPQFQQPNHQLHHVEIPAQQYQQQHQQQPTTSSHMGLVPNIEISHTDEDCSPLYYNQQQSPHQQQVNNSITPNDRSSSISAARSLPDIANLRVNSPSDCLSSSYSDQRLRSNTIGNNYDLGSNLMQSSDPSQDAGYYCPQLEHPHQHQQPELCYQQQQQQQQPVIITGTYDEYYHSPQQQHQQPQSSMVRANSSNAVMGNWSNNNTLYTPKMNYVLSRSSEDCCGNMDSLDFDSLM